MPELALDGKAVAEHEAPSRGAVALTVVAVGLVLVAQVPIVHDLLDPAAALGAAGAKGVLKLNALLAAITAVAAAVLPARLRALALVPGALVAAGTLGGALTLGGHLWDIATAVLTIAGAWWVGRLIIRALSARALQGVFVVELVVGLGVVGLGVLALGRLDILAWWSAGAIAIAIGAVGTWTAAREGWTRRRVAWSAVTGSRLGTACTGLLLLQLGWAIVWLSAPEIMYDALSAKAYLPELWAQTGSIGPLLAHPMLNVTGLTEVVAVPGHTLGAVDVGRDLQMLGWVTLVATTWWWAGSRSTAGPLAALLVGIVPQLVWESTTAYDDIVLALGVMALAVAVLRTRRPTLGTAVAIGLLTGTCVWLKLNMLALTAVLAIGWVLVAGSRHGLARRVAGVGLGALVIAGPALVLRWIDTGNPVFPTYNTIFKSPYYPLVNEQYDFPFWPGAGLWDAIRAPYDAVVNPSAMTVVIPAGTFGVLIPAMVLAVLVGWRRVAGLPERRAIVVWLAVVVALLAWWVQFRYLRYLLPTAVVSLVLVLAQLRGWRPRRSMTPVLLIAAAAAAALYLPSTVANFWNVPKRDLPFGAAFGRWDEHAYLQAVFTETDALNAFQQIAEPGATAVSNAHERTFLHDRELSAPWEVARLLELSGPLPTGADEALRRLRRLGIGWALVTGPDRSGQGTSWLGVVLKRHGELVFGDRGWDLYRLVARPAPPRMLTACDPDLRGRPGCWTGTFDATPGLADGESTGGAHRTVPVCPGETLAVQLRTAAVGQAAQVWLDADSGSTVAGHTSGSVPPGGSGWVYGTAPPGTHNITVTIGPGIYGGMITRARIGRLGRCASNNR